MSQPFDPVSAIVGQWQFDVDAASLRAGQQQVLDAERLQFQYELLDSSMARFTPIKVTTEGVIVDGHHGARAAAERGLPVNVLIVNGIIKAGPPIIQIPLMRR